MDAMMMNTKKFVVVTFPAVGARKAQTQVGKLVGMDGEFHLVRLWRKGKRSWNVGRPYALSDTVFTAASTDDLIRVGIVTRDADGIIHF